MPFRQPNPARNRLQGISSFMPAFPAKLKHDAIVDSIFEIRFEPGQELPEVVMGRLADLTRWPGFTAARLPFADLPQMLRLSDPNLRLQPLIQLTAPDGVTNVKVGTHAIHCDMPKPYQGWDAFYTFSSQMVDNLFGVIPTVEVRRLGLRYVNVIETELHHVRAISELRISVTVGAKHLDDAYNLNFRIRENENTECQIRIATKEFVNPPLDGPGHTIIDVDTYTPDGFSTQTKADIEAWLVHAREVKNGLFFGLFSEAQIEKMKGQ